MSKFLKSSLQKIEAYTPGEQPQDKKYIKLNTNESPFPPSEGVIKALNEQEVKDLRLYCDPECSKLRKAVAELYNVSENNVFLSNGSDDILNFSFMAFCEGDKRGVRFPEISYGFYSVYAELHGAAYKAVPLMDDAILALRDADMFIIIGTSLNVYPAAGLLNYVPSGIPVFLVDPDEVNVRGVRKIVTIRKGASEGMQEIVDNYL